MSVERAASQKLHFQSSFLSQLIISAGCLPVAQFLHSITCLNMYCLWHGGCLPEEQAVQEVKAEAVGNFMAKLQKSYPITFTVFYGSQRNKPNSVWKRITRGGNKEAEIIGDHLTDWMPQTKNYSYNAKYAI